MSIKVSGLYRFEGFEIDAANRLLTVDGKPVSVHSRPFDLLLYMVRNAGRLLTKEELMTAIWGGAAVEESNLTQGVFVLRKALASARPENKIIVTVSGKGYRFAAPVEEVAPAPAASEPEIEPPQAPPKTSRGPHRGTWFAIGAAVAALALAGWAIAFGVFDRGLTRPVPAPRPVTANTPENPNLALALSPDGRYLAYADARFVTLRTLASGETRTLPVDSGMIPTRLAWYPDGSRLIVCERTSDFYRLVSFSILSGKLSPLRENANTPALSPDGGRIAFTDSHHREIWIMDGNGEHPRRILTVAEPDKIYSMFWSTEGGRVWFAHVHWDKDKNSTTLETCDVNGANVTRVLSDNRMTAFALLPEGRLICAFAEGTQNFTNLWELRTDTADGKPRGVPRKLTTWSNFSISYMSATADGKHLAFLNGGWQADIYVGELRAGGTQLVNTRRLTENDSDDWPSFWTQDDQAVVFESNRNGRSQVFRQRLDQTEPELLSVDSGEDLQPSFGGPWIYFHWAPAGGRMVWDKPGELRRLPASGGASNVILRDSGVDVSCAAEKPEVCALARLRGKTLTFYRFSHAAGAGEQIGSMEFDSRLFPSFGVTPNGSEIAVLNPKGSGNRIRRIALADGRTSEVEVAGRKGLETLFPAGDGGWFVSSLTPSNGEYLLHVSPSGQSDVLFEQPDDGRVTWGVPSHDGKRLAFVKWTAPRNAWMIDGLR